MAIRNRRGSFRLELNEESTIFVEKREIMELTRIAKSWDFTCSFCFRRFASAQAMGGHLNAHRNERKEEKRLFVRNPIGYRKRVFIRALKMELAGLNVEPKIAKKRSRKAEVCADGDDAGFGMCNARFAKQLGLGAHANVVGNGDLKLDLDLKL